MSSGEAELNAALKGGCELTRVAVMLKELAGEVVAELYGDSSACFGTLHREGAGRIKHLEVKQLWPQQKVKAGTIAYNKISREVNPSDSLAKAC